MAMDPLFSSQSIPEFHDGMLFVQMRASSAPLATASAALAAVSEPPSSGLAAMAFYERAGLVKRVVPVPRRPSVAASGVSPMAFHASGAFGATAALMAAAGMGKDRTDAGLSLVELERNEDVPKLQLALANDPNVNSVSRIPVRYLAARAVAAGRSRRAPARAPTGAGIAAAVPPPDPSTMWNLRKIKWAEARALSGFADASNIDVAILDTGIDRAHPDLGDRVAQYVWEHPDLPQASSVQDIIGHGTHVAGTVAAGIDNGLGVNGICSSRLHAWKIFDDIPDLIQTAFGFRYVYFVDPVMYLRALLDCIDARVQVVNLSIGGPGRPSTPEAQAFQSLIANGTVVVAAMGNDREQGSPISYPAAIPGVVAVGATGLTDKVTTFSNRGNHISVCAPGEAIWSTLPTYPGQLDWEAIMGADGEPRQGKPRRREVNYDAWPGTSMATPHVTAAVALHLANGGQSGGAAVRQALINTVEKVPGMGGADFSPDYGYGRLDLQALIQQARQGAVS
jgi:subtilisin family serine protease